MRFVSVGAVCCGLFVLLSVNLVAADTYGLEDVISTPSPVVIDGSLSEWGPSTILGPASFDPDMADDYNASFRLMYDKNYLYLAAVVVEPYPPYNVFPTRGFGEWLGDDVIIRMCNNPKRAFPISMSDAEAKSSDELFTIEFWRDHLDKKVYWHGYRGIGGPLFKQQELVGVDAAVKPAKDGKGYTLEARIPLKLIGLSFQPSPGDKVAFVWEVSIANDSAADTTRQFQIFANGSGSSSF
jgi:hypothetical protein